MVFTGLDLSSPAIGIAQGKSVGAGVSERTRWVVGDVESLPFPDNSFDMVINVNMLHMVRNPIKMLNEMERVLKHGGLFMLTTIKRVWYLALFSRATRATYTCREAREIVMRSDVRPWRLTEGLIDIDIVSI
jgi:ubiquinone/menaquinone biosynthesis C-methylase UbiE